MKPERVVRLIAFIASAALLITLIAMAVTVLSGLVGILALLVSALLALVVMRLLGRRVPRATTLEVELDSGVIERVGSDPISWATSRNAVVVRDVVDALTRAASDDRVTGLVARLGNGGIQLGHAQELRDAVRMFRQAGKKTVAFSEAFGESRLATVDFYLACAFEQVFLQPRGVASIQGMLAKGRFVRGVFDNLGIVPDFDHRKEYKAAMYTLTEREFTEPHRESTAAVAGDQFDQIVRGIAQDRGLDESDVRALIDRSPLTEQEILDAGLVDRLGYRDDAYQAAKGNGSGFMFHDHYLKRAGRPHRKGARIGLVYGTGSINRGSSSFDPLTRGPSLGADDVAKAIRSASDDDKVKAIVFRVDSPGGSAVASEVVRREVVRAQEAGKPVVVSMGNVAGSGGYWISANADRIIAQPGTITGSIGVVSGKLANREAWARLGVTFDEIRFGRNATFESSQDVYTESERERLETILDTIYRDFTSLVATSRRLEPEHVEGIARGRIWTGAQASRNGLVDGLGGLETAIEFAKEVAGIETDQPVELRLHPRKKALPLPERRTSSEPVRDAFSAIFGAVDNLAGAIAGIQLRMPGG